MIPINVPMTGHWTLKLEQWKVKIIVKIVILRLLISVSEWNGVYQYNLVNGCDVL